MKINKFLSFGTALAMLLGLAVAVPAFAQTTNAMPPKPGWGHGEAADGWMTGGKPAVVGTVSAVSGSSLTVSAITGFNKTSHATTTTVFTVDATNATVMKNNATSAVSSIAVGDHVVVRGTVSGTNVTATSILDGQAMMRIRGDGDGKDGKGSTTPPFVGNGEPVIAGSVSAINGSTLTVANKAGSSYTVNATNAKILQGKNTISLTSIKVGDNVVVQGAVNGTSVTASTVLDSSAQASSTKAAPKNFLGSIGNFFRHLFGF